MSANPAKTTERAELWQARFNTPILLAAALVIPIMVLEHADLEKPWPTILAVANLLTWLAFLAEVVVMLAVSPDRKEWALSHKLEIAVVVLTPPFLYTALAPLRSLRLLRLLRIAPLLKRLFVVSGGERYVALVAFGILIAGSIAYHELQPGVSIWTGLRLALLSTVSSFIPPQIRTQPGHIAALITVIFGSTMISYLKGSLALKFVQNDTGPRPSDSNRATRALTAAQRDLMTSVKELHRRLDALEAPANPPKDQP